MDDVDRMYRHLVRTIRATSPQLLTQPFQVGDLYTTILPYRLHRRELGVETNQDYEMALLELLSGARGYLRVDDRMRDELGTMLKSPNPDPSVIRNFAAARVALAPDPLDKLEDRATVAATGAGSAPSDASGAAPSMAEPGSPLTIPIAPIKEPTTAPFRASATATASGGASETTLVPSAAPATAQSPAQPAPRAAGAMPSASSSAAPTRRATRPITVSPNGEQCPHCRGELPAGREIVFCPHCGQDLTILHCPACGSELEHGWKFCVTCGRATTDL